MNIPLYRGIQDDMITIKCCHDELNFDDPFYPFCVDHLRSAVSELLNIKSTNSDQIMYIANTLTDLIDRGCDAEAAAFASAGFHFIDKLLGQADGSTFNDRLKTLREGFGDGYFPWID